MIAENPAVTFVAAHPGEREYFLKHLQRLEKYENAYLDLSGTGCSATALCGKGSAGRERGSSCSGRIIPLPIRDVCACGAGRTYRRRGPAADFLRKCETAAGLLGLK